MTTKSQINRVVSAINSVESKVADTMVEIASNITSTCKTVFGGLIPEKAEVDAIVAGVTESASWRGTKAQAARQSEVRSIVKAYPYIGTAAGVFKREYGELRREHFIKLARMCPEYETPTDAALDTAAYFEARDKGKGAGKSMTPKQKVAAAFKQALNATTDARLKRSLYALAKKHNIKVDK